MEAARNALIWFDLCVFADGARSLVRLSPLTVFSEWFFSHYSIIWWGARRRCSGSTGRHTFPCVKLKCSSSLGNLNELICFGWKTLSSSAAQPSNGRVSERRKRRANVNWRWEYGTYHKMGCLQVTICLRRRLSWWGRAARSLVHRCMMQRCRSPATHPRRWPCCVRVTLENCMIGLEGNRKEIHYFPPLKSRRPKKIIKKHSNHHWTHPPINHPDIRSYRHPTIHMQFQRYDSLHFRPLRAHTIIAFHYELCSIISIAMHNLTA